MSACGLVEYQHVGGREFVDGRGAEMSECGLVQLRLADGWGAEENFPKSWMLERRR